MIPRSRTAIYAEKSDAKACESWLLWRKWFWLLFGATLIAVAVSISHGYWQIASQLDEDLHKLGYFIDIRLDAAERALLELDQLEFDRCNDAAKARLVEFSFAHSASGFFLTRPLDEQGKIFCSILGSVSPDSSSRVIATVPIPGKPKLELLVVEHWRFEQNRTDLFLSYHGERRFNSVQIPLNDSFVFFEEKNEAQRRVISRLGGQHELTRHGLLSEAAQWGQRDVVSQAWPIQLEAGIGDERVVRKALTLLPFWLLLCLSMAGLVAYALQLREMITTHKFRFHRALERNEFVGYFQPIVDVRAKKIVGSELLLRWCKADGTVISPAHFVHDLEQSSLIQAVTQQLLQSLGSQLAPVLATDPHFRCGVNLVPAQLEHPEMADWLEGFSKQFDCRQLAFEITERLPITDMAAAKRELTRIKALGVEIELDDAGTGYGGASYLQELHIDVLKIDKLFVDTLLIWPRDTSVLDAYIRLGQSLGLKIIAEGVETEAQSKALLARGVSLQQGFLFAAPLPAEEFVAFYRDWCPRLIESGSGYVLPDNAKKVMS